MKKLNEVEAYLLTKWEDVIKLQECVKYLQTKIGEMCKAVCEELKNRDWWPEEFEEPVYKSSSIFIYKKSWHFGKDIVDAITPHIWGLSLDSLMGYKDIPCAGIWSEPLKKLGEGKREKFDRLFNTNSETERIRKLLPNNLQVVKDPQCAFAYRLPFSVAQWIEILREGRFVDTILEQFDTLAQFIDPIDRASGEVIGIKKRRK